MFNENENFYPTPEKLVYKMLEKIDLRKIKYILEPSCGKGNIIEYTKKYFEANNRSIMGNKQTADNYLTFDAIENDDNLISLCRGKGINIVWSDFLTFDPPRFYDLILINPPFINGDKHLLQALRIQERVGGEIVCILNADTLKNPYSNDRKQLIKKLNQYNADIKYIEEAFSDAERKTNVEIALIYVQVPMVYMETMFEKEFKQDNAELHIDHIQALMPKMNKLEKLVFEYNVLKNATIELYKEKLRVDNLLKGFGIDPFIDFKEKGYSREEKLQLNEFINKINLLYWKKFIEETDFKKKLPSKLRDNFNYNIEKQKNIAFTIENLRYFTDELMKAIPRSYEENVASVFEECTSKHSYSDASWNTNIHMYNGWKTNNAYKVNKKVIIPCHYSWGLYRVPDVLNDLNIIFNNISGANFNIDTNEICKAIERAEKNIETEHFLLDSYKKGTIHIKFKDQNYLNIFNILAGKGKNWLPDDFMTKSYSDMTPEEKDLVKEFGLTPSEYNNLSLVSNTNNYLGISC
jgi:hypothetical protein